MSVKTEPVPPSPDHTPPLEGDAGTSDQGRRLSHAWSRWFVSLREKVNVINEVVEGLSALVGGGFVVVNGGTAIPRSIEGTAGDIDVADGDGIAGNPTISSASTGVTPGAYVLATVTVNAAGKITLIAATDAPSDGEVYIRRNGAWESRTIIPEAPEDGSIYGRQDGAWVEIP